MENIAGIRQYEEKAFPFNFPSSLHITSLVNPIFTSISLVQHKGQVQLPLLL